MKYFYCLNGKNFVLNIKSQMFLLDYRKFPEIHDFVHVVKFSRFNKNLLESLIRLNLVFNNICITIFIEQVI